MTALDDCWLDAPARELPGECERCGEHADTTLTADGELCAECAREIAAEKACRSCGEAPATGLVFATGWSGDPLRICDGCRDACTANGLRRLVTPARMREALARLASMRAAGIDPLLPYDRSSEQRGAAE